MLSAFILQEAAAAINSQEYNAGTMVECMVLVHLTK